MDNLEKHRADKKRERVERIKRAADLCRAGKSRYEISEEMGISHNMICTYIREAGLAKKKRATENMVMKMHIRGKHINEIAVELDIKPSTISSYIAKNSSSTRVKKHSIDLVYVMHNLGCKHSEISLKTGLNVSAVKTHIRDANKCEECGKLQNEMNVFKGKNICDECLNPEYEDKVVYFGHSSLVNAAV